MLPGLALLIAGAGVLVWLLRSRHRPRPDLLKSELTLSLIIVAMLAMFVFGVALTIRSLTS